MKEQFSLFHYIVVYPGALLRMLLYWNKRSFKELVEDGFEINAMALLWVLVMFVIWYKIITK